MINHVKTINWRAFDEHEVHFGTLGETVVLKHVAHTRDTFVRGALRAAAWVAGRPAGLYSMHDVLAEPA